MHVSTTEQRDGDAQSVASGEVEKTRSQNTVSGGSEGVGQCWDATSRGAIREKRPLEIH